MLVVRVEQEVDPHLTPGLHHPAQSGPVGIHSEEGDETRQGTTRSHQQLTPRHSTRLILHVQSLTGVEEEEGIKQSQADGAISGEEGEVTRQERVGRGGGGREDEGGVQELGVIDWVREDETRGESGLRCRRWRGWDGENCGGGGGERREVVIETFAFGGG